MSKQDFFFSTLVRQHSDHRCHDLLDKSYLLLELGTSTSPTEPQQTKLLTVVSPAVILCGIGQIAWITFTITTPT